MTRAGLALLAFAAVLLAHGPARAGLTAADLARVEVAPAADARVPGDLALLGLDGATVTFAEAGGGRPVLVVPFDAACRVVCGPALSLLAGALADADLEAGRDVAVLLPVIAHADDDTVRDFVRRQGAERGTTVVTGPDDAVARLLAAIGYRTAPDPENDAVAHPSAFVALTPDGRVSRVLSSLALNPTDLRLAVVEAGGGRVGDLGDRLRLLCYGFDAVHGLYTARITGLLRAGGAATVLALAAAIWFMARRRPASGDVA